MSSSSVSGSQSQSVGSNLSAAKIFLIWQRQRFGQKYRWRRPLTDFSLLEVVPKTDPVQGHQWLRLSLSIGGCLDKYNRDGTGGYFRQPSTKSQINHTHCGITYNCWPGKGEWMLSLDLTEHNGWNRRLRKEEDYVVGPPCWVR